MTQKDLDKTQGAGSRTGNAASVVPIAFITDSGYVVPTATAIASLIRNKKSDTYYHIFVVTCSLDEADEANFVSFSSDSVKVEVIRAEVGELASLHDTQKGGICCATPAALLKFYLPSLVKQYDKLLYLDGDMLILQDLAELYKTDLGDNYVAAVRDSGTMYYKRPIVKQVPLYFNSGVMLLNLAAMRERKLTQVLIETKAADTDSTLMDQDTFNRVFNNHSILLDIKYNFLILNLKRAVGKWDIPLLNSFYSSDYVSLGDVERHAVVVHFSSKDKPWKYTDGLYSDEWYYYFLQTPYRERKLDRVPFLQQPQLPANAKFTVKQKWLVNAFLALMGLSSSCKREMRRAMLTVLNKQKEKR